MSKKVLLFLSMMFVGGAGAASAWASSNVVNHVMLYNTADGTLSSRIDYTYDADGRMIEELTTVPTSDGGMENLNKSVYGYDEQNRRNLVENYEWDDNLLDFVGSSSVDNAKTLTTFNAEGLPQEVLYWLAGSDWSDGESWEYKGTFEYNGDSGTENRYRKINGILKGDPDAVFEYTYDANKQVIEKVRNNSAFDFESYEYVLTPSDRWVYEYDEHGNKTLEELYANLGGTEAEWARMYSYKYEYTYDNAGNVSRRVEYWWSDEEADYTIYSDLTYEYHYSSNDALELPYSNNFDTAGALDGFGFEDGNGDGDSWTLSGGTLTCGSSKASDGPEIIYLPAMRFSTDNEAEISFNAKVADAGYPAAIQLILCENDSQHTPLGPIGKIWDITGTEYQKITGLIVPEDNSPYVIGICFDNNQVGATLVIDDLEVKEGRSTETPAAPYSFTAIPAGDGSLQVELVWYAPNQNIGGGFINHVDKMELYRDGVDEPIHVTEAVGATLASRFIDTDVPAAGEYTYRVYATLDGMRSDAAVVTVKVGYAVPSPMENFRVTENDDHTVTLSWDAPAAEDGDVKYYIIRNNETVLAEAHEGNSFIDNGIDTSNGQVYCYYRVLPFNEIGYGEATYSELLFVGESLPVPYNESFAGGVTTHQWMNEIVTGYDAAWGVGSSRGTITPQDADGGLAVFMSTMLTEGSVVRFTSEKIDLSSLASPELSFYVYHLPGEVTGDALVIEASKDNGEYEIVSDPINVSGYDEEGWTLHTVSLERFSGEKNVRLSFRGISGMVNDIALDNITVGGAGCSGIDNILAGNAKVYAADGEIRVSADGDCAIRIFSIGGVMIYSDTVSEARVPVAQGVYVVTVDGEAVKVVVK